MPTPVLTYTPVQAQAPPRGRRRVGWLLLAIPSAVVPFVPFACKATPVGTVHEWVTATDRWDREAVMITALAVGLIAALYIHVWRLRAFVRRPIKPIELVVAHSVAAVTAAGFLLALGLIVTANGLDATAWVAIAVSASCFVPGAWACWLLRRPPRGYEFSLLALLVPYVATSVICLIAFYSDREVGWYLTAISGPAALAEAVPLAWAQIRSRGGGTIAEIKGPALVGAPGEGSSL